jgi:hypothetical protein
MELEWWKKIVCSIVRLNLFNTYFSIVHMLISCGELFIYCLVLQDQLTYLIYLIIGVNWGEQHNLLLLTAAVALCWTIWVTRNEVVFDRCRPKTFLQVLFRGMHWLRQWA